MAVLSVSLCNPILSATCQRLLCAGKRPKVALVTLMRRLAGLMNLVPKQPNFSLAR